MDEPIVFLHAGEIKIDDWDGAAEPQKVTINDVEMTIEEFRRRNPSKRHRGLGICVRNAEK